jgi:4-carboxymuconolactone decarboxylase
MRFPVVVAALTIVAAVAQTPSAPPNFTLTGDRFKPLTWDQMSPAQKTMVQHILAGDRKNLGGPFNVLLRSPEMGDLAQSFGAQARFHSSLPPRLNELAIIVTARFWMVQYEWNAHRKAAATAGVSEDTIQAIATGKRPAKLAADETAVYNFATELLNDHSVSDATFAAAKNAVGEKGVVDMISVMGYYQMVAMLLNVDRYPMPEGVAPELKPLP